jgi:hypothetical protein
VAQDVNKGFFPDVGAVESLFKNMLGKRIERCLSAFCPGKI